TSMLPAGKNDYDQLLDLAEFWDPYVETSTDHSLMQCGLQNYDNPQRQSLEGGWTVDQSLNGDWQPHLFVYYTTNGYTQDSDNLGGYNQDVDGWVQYSSVIYPGAGWSALSSQDQLAEALYPPVSVHRELAPA